MLVRSLIDDSRGPAVPSYEEAEHSHGPRVPVGIRHDLVAELRMRETVLRGSPGTTARLSGMYASSLVGGNVVSICETGIIQSGL